MYTAPSKQAQGEALYAKVDIPPYTVYALYGGFTLTQDEMDDLRKSQNASFNERGIGPKDPEAIGAWMYRSENKLLIFSLNVVLKASSAVHLQAQHSILRP